MNLESDQHTNLLSLPSPVFIVGPAYSGKSSIATQCLDQNERAIVIGTAVAHDQTISKRIEHLQSNRPDEWSTLEPLTNSADAENLATVLSEQITKYPQILVDSVSQWIASKLVNDTAKYTLEQIQTMLEQQCREIRTLVDSAQSTRIVMVSSEVGSAPSPMRSPERLFRMATGLLNQELASLSRSVISVTAGIPQLIK